MICVKKRADSERKNQRQPKSPLVLFPARFEKRCGWSDYSAAAQQAAAQHSAGAHSAPSHAAAQQAPSHAAAQQAPSQAAAQQAGASTDIASASVAASSAGAEHAAVVTARPPATASIEAKLVFFMCCVPFTGSCNMTGRAVILLLAVPRPRITARLWRRYPHCAAKAIPFRIFAHLPVRPERKLRWSVRGFRSPPPRGLAGVFQSGAVGPAIAPRRLASRVGSCIGLKSRRILADSSRGRQA